MKVLFVASGNIKKFGISPIISNQMESLKKSGLEIEIYPVTGKGSISYLKCIPKLRKKIIKGGFDLVHSHYSFSGYVSLLTFTKTPKIVSLMGSDIKKRYLEKLILQFFCRYLWKVTIVKSKEMATNLRLKNAFVIPNGVNTELFKPLDKNKMKLFLNYKINKHYITFIGDPSRKEKNFQLAYDAFELLKKSTDNLELNIVFGESGVSHNEIPKHINASDVVILTSIYEGSPNVIKEAMACNIPIVSTDVGDVKENISSISGCYVCESNPKSVSEAIKKALKVERTTARQKILNSLDESIISQKIIELYKNAIRN